MKQLFGATGVGDWDPIRPIAEQEARDLDRAGRALRTFESDRAGMTMVLLSHEEFDASFGSDARQNSSVGIPNPAVLTIDASRRLLNFVTAVRFFLDGTERRMKRRYGRDSEAVRTFKGACAAAFDEVFAYRFTWKLRNYMQHCDLPFGRVEFVCTEGTTVDSGAEFAARLMFDPQVLLKRYDGWGPVRNDLEELREPFEVFPILAEVVAELTKIESACIEMEVPELRAAISIIQSIIADEYDPERGFAVVDLAEVSRSAHRSGATIAYQIIPTHLVREFQQALIRAGHPPTA